MQTLSAKNATYIYDSKKCDGVDKINFDLEPGQLCAILGPSGSGKTTLLKLLAKNLSPQKGSVNIPSHLQTALYLPFESLDQQRFGKITLLDFLREDTTLHEDIIRDQISFLELSDELHSPLAHLSLGQWHRAQLGKFFFNDSSLLLLDEPFIHLDPSRRQFIADCLLRLAKENNKFVFWSTHFIDDALLLADKILLLQHGVQQQFSSPSDLYWKPENLFAAQYLGANNLILATPSDDQRFETALGTIQTHSENALGLGSSEVVLMCRPHLCNVQSHRQNNAQHQWLMVLKKISFFGAYQRLEFQHQQRTWWVDVPSMLNNSNNQIFEVDQEYWVEVPTHAWTILKTY